MSEHQKEDSLVDQIIVECGGSKNDIELKIVDACRAVEILETKNTSKLKPWLNTGDENRGRELTLKY